MSNTNANFEMTGILLGQEGRKRKTPQGERSEFCVTLKTLQRHHVIQSPFKING